MKIALIIIMALLLATGRSEGGETVLTLEKFLAEAVKHDANLEPIVAEKLQARFHRELQAPDRRYLVQLRGEYGIDPASDTTTSSMVASVEKQITDSGTQVLASITQRELADRKEKVSSITIEQPLYRNGFGRGGRLLLDILDDEQQLILLQVAESYEGYMATLVGVYLDFKNAYLQVQAAQRLYGDALTLLDQVERKQKRGIADRLDVDRLRLESLSRYGELVAAKSEFGSVESKIIGRIGTHNGTRFKPEVGSPLFPTAPEQLDQDAQSAVTNGRTMTIATLATTVSDKKVTWREQEERVEVNLVAGYQSDHSQRYATSSDVNEVVIGVSVTAPLGDHRGDARMAQASYEKVKSIAGQHAAEQNLSETLAGLKVMIQQQTQIVQNAALQLALADRIANEQKRRFLEGERDLDEVVASQRVLAQNRYAVGREQVALDRLALEWRSQTDQLIGGATPIGDVEK
jgi:outer membrane protein TolC